MWARKVIDFIDTISVLQAMQLAGHPEHGVPSRVSVIELVARGPGLGRQQGRQWSAIRDQLQAAAQGAVPTLYAVVAQQARPGAYYGSTGKRELRGPLGLATVSSAAGDAAAAARLWAVTEEHTGTLFPSLRCAVRRSRRS